MPPTKEHPHFASIEEVLHDLNSGAYTSEELTQSLLQHIQDIDQEVGAFLRIDAEGALEAARQSDTRRKNGEPLGLLEGIPLSIKDQIVTKGIETTAASKILAG